jgi:hypothetical protein
MDIATIRLLFQLFRMVALTARLDPPTAALDSSVSVTINVDLEIFVSVEDVVQFNRIAFQTQAYVSMEQFAMSSIMFV